MPGASVFIETLITKFLTDYRIGTVTRGPLVPVMDIDDTVT